MLVNPAVLGPGGLPVSAASWLVGVHTASIPPGQASELGHRLGATAATLTRAQRLGGLQVSTGLPQVLAGLASTLVVARSLLLIGSLQLLLLAIAAAALAAQLLTSQRDEETALLSARGVARAQLVRVSLAEVCLLAVIGAAAVTGWLWRPGSN
jgi:predicted lysophospholipase L1 biosynthesis ABC-type transport system permease subunit